MENDIYELINIERNADKYCVDIKEIKTFV